MVAAWFVVFSCKGKMLCQNEYNIHKNWTFLSSVCSILTDIKVFKINWTYCNSQTYAPDYVKILKQQKYMFLNQSVTFVISFFKHKPPNYLSEMSGKYHKR